MEDTERTALLKDEYLQLQKTIEDFDARALTIKAWSVTFSLVALTAAFASHAPAALLVGSLSAALFWLTEGFWKTFQTAYYDRVQSIEDYFAGEIHNIVPMQIKSSWYVTWKKGGKRRLLHVMRWPHVALPHAIVFLVGLSLFVLYQASVVPV